MANPTTGHDVLKGTAGHDKIDGLAGNDTIQGFSGNDTLIGNTGNDSLDGGVGNDSLVGGAGIDTLLGGSGHDYLTGGADNDNLAGGNGNDTLDGGTGADTMIGGANNDSYVVDNQSDLIVEDKGSTAGKDSVSSSVNYILPANVEKLTLTGQNNLTGTGNDDANAITGNDGDNVLDGKNGNDTLAGGDGDDTLLGGGGTDVMTGGDGSDTYRVSSMEDKIIETARDGDQDVIESTANYSLGDNLEVLTLVGAYAVEGTGNELDNVIEGSDEIGNALYGREGNDELYGYGGDDTLDGGEGDDSIDGGDGQDQVVYLGNESDYKYFFDEESQIWTVQDVNGTDGDGVDEGTDLLTNVEQLVFADNTVDLVPVGVTTPDVIPHG